MLRRIERDEAGATLVMSVVVMMILTALTTAVLARTLSVLSFVRHGQDFDAALAAADAGLADALFQIDQDAPASFAAKCPADGATAPCGIGEGRSFEYWATKLSDSEYVVSSIGRVGAARHALQARVNRTAQFPYALFSREALHLDGTTNVAGLNLNFYSFTAGILDNGAPVRIGSNATVVCNGPPDPNVYIDWFQAQSECPSTRVTKMDKARDLAIREPPPPPGETDINWENCPIEPAPPGGGTPRGVFGLPNTTAANPVLVNGSSGPFVCRRDVALLGTVIPDPTGTAVEIYVLPTYDALTGTVVEHHDLDLSTAVVNPPTILPAQAASRFQIFKVGDEPITTIPQDQSGTVTFRGVLFAPDTPLTINGGISWVGSINVGQLRVNGAPNLKIGYDNDLSTYLGPDWTVSRYREVAAAEAGPISSTPPTTAPTTTTTTTLVPTTTTITVPTTTTSSTTTTSTTSSTTLIPPLEL